MKKCKAVLISVSLFIAFNLSSCAGLGGMFSNAKHIPMTKQVYPPKPKNYTVDQYFGKNIPNRDYIEIARIDATYYATTIFDNIGNGILALMCARCRELGGDAIIQIEYHIGVQGSVGQNTGNGSCIAVVWR